MDGDVFDALLRHLDVALECFASPLNCRSCPSLHTARNAHPHIRTHDSVPRGVHRAFSGVVQGARAKQVGKSPLLCPGLNVWVCARLRSF